MRLSSATSGDEIRIMLEGAARESWGPERTAALTGGLDGLARAIHMVMQVSLAPLSEEPELSTLAYRPAPEV